MLKDGTAARLFIRVSIWCLRAVAPLSLAYCTFRLGTPLYLPSTPAIHVLDIYAGAESLFFLLVYIPRRIWLNEAAPPHLSLSSREERRKTSSRIWEATPDPRPYVSLWFKGVPVEALCREDVKDWLCWGMWNKMDRSLADEEELEEYFSQTERALDHKFPEGHSGNSSMAVTFEPLRMMHRPLIWYSLFVGGADLYTSTSLLLSGYQHYRLPLTRQLSSLPLRPLSLMALHRSPSQAMSYWYLPHTSATHLPILFIHGIGVGLYPYVPFLRELQRLNHQLGIGTIALEVAPICSRISPPFTSSLETPYEIQSILEHHKWSRCMIISHSYGSVVCAHLLHNPETASLIGPLLFVDPVAFAFHDPHIPWNFLRRRPTTASEIQLQYFASMDPDVAHTLTRRFVWPENSVWREEVEDRAREDEKSKCTVALSGKDIITNTNIVGRYLTRDRSKDENVKWCQEPEDQRMNDEWKRKEWTGDEPLEVMWFPELNHAEIFDAKEDWARLIEVVQRYSKDGVAGAEAGDEDTGGTPL